MDSNTHWKKWVVRLLTRWFIRLSKRTAPLEPKELNLLEETVTVFPFKTESQFLAQVTPFGTIIWNEQRMEGLSGHAQKVVLRHEQSHQERNSVFKWLLYGLSLWFSFGLLAIILAGVSLLSGTGISSAVFTGVIGVIAMTVFIIAVRIDETIADYHALRDLGEEEFITGYSDLSSAGDSSIFAAIMRHVLYSTPKQTITIHRLVHRIKNTLLC